ncbi:MAG: peroxiredoxin family protein [Planctomycetota bacterium]|jgi:peroxiredoxin
MLQPHPSSTLVALLISGLASTCLAQDRSLDLPYRRAMIVPGYGAPSIMIKAADSQIPVFVGQGLMLLQAGWDWEAGRNFREVVHRDANSPIGHLGLALSMRDIPRSAAKHAWYAVFRRDNASPAGKAIVSAYGRYFDVKARPDDADERFDQAPPQARLELLAKELNSITAKFPDFPLAAGLAMLEGAELESARSGQATIDRKDRFSPALGASWRNAGLTPEASQDSTKARHFAYAAIRSHNRYLSYEKVMPFLVPGYRQDLQRLIELTAVREGEETSYPVPTGFLDRLPRHPHFESESQDRVPVAGEILLQTKAAEISRPDLIELGPAIWEPPAAPGFDLVRGLGGSRSYEDYRGKPLLVVFFLGFGCVHCIAQLGDLDPMASQFSEAGIEVITIGTDTVQQVRASHQMALENGIDPLHFDVLCDPAGESFKAWRAWDQYKDEALHGTFLVDQQGRIIWQDISAQPFMETQFLLEECKRLLTAWK